jgi:peptide/nickel transport system permease protein
MARIFARKVALLVVVLPLLHMAAFYYAQRVFPQLLASIGAIAGASRSLAVADDASSAGAFFPTYRAYLRQVASGDLGTISGVPLTAQLGGPLTNSLVLVALAFGATLLLGLPLGVASLSRRTDRVSPGATLLLTAGSSLPSYFFGAVTVALVVYTARYLYHPIRDLVPWQGFGFDQHLILPVLALAIRPVFYVARIVAGLLEDELQHDYVRTARSKGVPWRGLLWRHAVPNIVSPTTVAIGHTLRIIASQLIVVEALFNWPGLGRMTLLTLGIRTDGSAPTALFGNAALLATLSVLFGLLLLGSDSIASLLAYRADPRLRRPEAALARA